jgi:PAS domain S-box-containing protein
MDNINSFNTQEFNSSGSNAGEKARPLTELDLILSTFNSIPNCISITDINDIVLYVNKSFASTYGYSTGELVGKSIKIIRSEKNDPEYVKQILPATLKDGWHGRLWNKRSDGADFYIDLRTSIVRDEKGNPIAYVGVAQDLTEQLKAEEDLRTAQDKYKTLFKELKDIVYESTPDGMLIELNPPGCELFGITSLDEFQNIDIARDLYAKEDERNSFKKELETKGFVKDYEIHVRKKTGEIVTALETSYAIKDGTGKIIAYRGIIRDVTEQKKNEETLKQLVEKLEEVNSQLKESEEELKNTNASKDKFFSIIAHDLRSPFSSLLSFSEFLMEDIQILSKEEIRSFSEKINESAKSVFSLLENLLQWSRIQSGKIPFQPATFNISYKINQVINLLQNNAQNKNIRIINEVPSSTAVNADEDMMYSVIQNLLSNAIKFTKENGLIIFRSVARETEYEITILDTGVGIREEDLQKLFLIDSHITTAGTNDEKGSGLGLILCKEMIERNHGKIWAYSRLNEGTSFTFTLPKA